MFWLAEAGVIPSLRAAAAMLPSSTLLTKLSTPRNVSISPSIECLRLFDSFAYF